MASFPIRAPLSGRNRTELAGRESGVESAEARIAASLDRLEREIRGIKLAQQALFAFTDALAKKLLTCLAEPPRDAYDQAIARGRLRYDRFLKSVGVGMAGDSNAAMAEPCPACRKELTMTHSGFSRTAHPRGDEFSTNRRSSMVKL
jgi:hypothetical protein